jgi:hypothetical protein
MTGGIATSFGCRIYSTALFQCALSSPTIATVRSRSTRRAYSSSLPTTTRSPRPRTTTFSAGSFLPRTSKAPITLHDKPVDKQITEDEKDFGFSGTTVNAHSTLAGYLFYDVRQLDDYPLKGAELFVKMVYTVPGKEGNKKELFDFNIPFDKWLAAQGEKPADKPADKGPDATPKN